MVGFGWLDLNGLIWMVGFTVVFEDDCIMPTSLSFEEHLDVIRASGDRMASLAGSVDESTKVPTCPAWDVRALLAHQTTVHRWATANVVRTDPNAVASQTEVRKSVDDIVTYFEQGLDELIAALQAAPEDLKAMTFLKDAPNPRAFWARRQAHETTMHMIDALSATVGGFPSTDEAAVDVAVAIDGIDELLCGFFTRGRSKLFDGEQYSILVEPADDGRRWVVSVAEQLTTDPDPKSDLGDLDVDVVLTGSAAQLYLGLWNRGDEIVTSGRTGLLARWRETQRIKWS